MVDPGPLGSTCRKALSGDVLNKRGKIGHTRQAVLLVSIRNILAERVDSEQRSNVRHQPLFD